MLLNYYIMEEIWKPIEGYEGLYEISSYGRVKSLERYRSNNGGIQLLKERIMNPLDYNGYKNVLLWKNGSKKKEYVHRLVAKAFLPNPDNLKEVNHKDENPSNNMVENLEWCDHRYNMNYGTARERARVKMINNGCYLDMDSDEKKIYRKEYYKKWREEHKGEQIEYHKKWREEHKEYMKEYHKRYYQEHKRG